MSTDDKFTLAAGSLLGAIGGAAGGWLAGALAGAVTAMVVRTLSHWLTGMMKEKV